MTALLEMRRISKTFPGVKALDDVTMSVGAKLYKQQAEDKKAEEEADAKAKATDKKPGKDEPVEGEVVDEKGSDKK